MVTIRVTGLRKISNEAQLFKHSEITLADLIFPRLHFLLKPAISPRYFMKKKFQVETNLLDLVLEEYFFSPSSPLFDVVFNAISFLEARLLFRRSFRTGLRWPTARRRICLFSFCFFLFSQNSLPC